MKISVSKQIERLSILTAERDNILRKIEKTQNQQNSRLDSALEKVLQEIRKVESELAGIEDKNSGEQKENQGGPTAAGWFLCESKEDKQPEIKGKNFPAQVDAESLAQLVEAVGDKAQEFTNAIKQLPQLIRRSESINRIIDEVFTILQAMAERIVKVITSPTSKKVLKIALIAIGSAIVLYFGLLFVQPFIPTLLEGVSYFATTLQTAISKLAENHVMKYIVTNLKNLVKIFNQISPYVDYIAQILGIDSRTILTRMDFASEGALPSLAENSQSFLGRSSSFIRFMEMDPIFALGVAGVGAAGSVVQKRCTVS